MNGTKPVNLKAFTYKGKEYQIDKVTELESDLGNRRIQITTTCDKKFDLIFKESIFKWVISETPLSASKV